MASPIANPASGSGAEDAATRIAIILSGNDADGAIDHFTIGTAPTDGQLFDAPTGGNLLGSGATVLATTDQATVFFQPNLDFNGSNNFTYTASQGGEDSAAATADITVTAVQDAFNDIATTNEDVTTTVDVLANDQFEDPARELTSFTNGAHGTVTRDDNGTPGNLADDKLIYTPDADFNGTDSFTYTVTPPNGTAETATANVTVSPVNDAPNVVNGNTESLATILEDAPNPPGSVISTLLGGHFSDADDAVPGGSSANAFAGIAVSANAATAAQGAWQWSTDGNTWTS